MKKAICHYSFHRRCKAEGWTPLRLAEEVAALGVEGVDFHAGLLGGADAVAVAPEQIRSAIAKTGRRLSGLSLSNNFNQADPHELRTQIETVKQWIGVGADLAAPVMRIFGGHLKDRYDPQACGEARQHVLDALREVVEVAEDRGVVLALENHGGMPCTGEEQVAVIQEVGSEHLRATVDVGNYMSCGQEGHIGTQIAAPFAAYVHFKDFHKVIDERALWGWQARPATVGQGDVDLPACLAALKAAGFDGFVALEYEGTDDEALGVPQSVEFMNDVMAGF